MSMSFYSIFKSFLKPTYGSGMDIKGLGLSFWGISSVELQLSVSKPKIHQYVYLPALKYFVQKH